MPKSIKGSPIEIMKAISMFDIDTDFEDNEAKEKLGILIHNLIMSEDPKAREFFDRFFKEVNNVIADMGIIEKPEEEEPVDDVEFPDEEETNTENPEGDIPDEEGGESEEEPTLDDVMDDEGDNVDDVPDEVLGDSFNPLITRANSFLNY